MAHALTGKRVDLKLAALPVDSVAPAALDITVGAAHAEFELPTEVLLTLVTQGVVILALRGVPLPPVLSDDDEP